MDASTERFLCVASYEKGHDFMRQCAEMGVRPTLLTLEGLRLVWEAHKKERSKT